MSVLESSTLLVMGELVQGALKLCGGAVGEAASVQVVGLLHRQFRDHSQRLSVAIKKAADRAWRAVEFALEGDSLWQRLKRKATATADEQAFAAQVQRYLEGAALGEIHVDRGRCLAELRAARKAGALQQGEPRSEETVREPDFFVRFRDPAAQLQQEISAGRAIAAALRQDYPHLAAMLAIQAGQGQPLLAVAMRYFFRRAVEEDERLARGLALAQSEQLQAGQKEGFAALDHALTAVGDRLEGLLGEVAAAVHETHRNVLDIHAEQQQQGQQLRQLYEEVMRLQGRFDLPPAEVRPRDSLSIRGDEERGLVKRLVERFRQLSPDQRRQLPALLNGIGKLELAAGDFQAANADFATVAGLVRAPEAQGEAHHNAYRAALERRDWSAALRHLQLAIAADPIRFAPFPDEKYQAVRILGAGGFGVAFLCQHRLLKAPVVVKTLSGDDLERGVDAVFGEAQVLSQLNHPAIIRLQDCGFANAAGRARPYLAMDYFEGATLEEVVERQGALSDKDALAVAWQIAAGLEAAHAKNVLHRDVKPGNVLLRQEDGEWEVKLIDFGLAVRHGGAAALAAASGTLAGASIAGTLDYAAPEQMGRLPGVGVSPRSDVYGLGRTCCYALFGTPSPLGSHWDRITKTFRNFLEPCLSERPQDRPADMNEVLALLDKVRSKKQPASSRSSAPPPPPTPSPPVAPPTPLAPPQFAEAEALLAALRRGFEAGMMERLGSLLRWLGQHAPGDHYAALLAGTRAVLHDLTREPRPAFLSASSALQAAPAPRLASALTWQVLLSLRALAARPG